MNDEEKISKLTTTFNLQNKSWEYEINEEIKDIEYLTNLSIDQNRKKDIGILDEDLFKQLKKEFREKKAIYFNDLQCNIDGF